MREKHRQTTVQVGICTTPATDCRLSLQPQRLLLSLGCADCGRLLQPAGFMDARLAR
jgi:hypothetical protein